MKICGTYLLLPEEFLAHHVSRLFGLWEEGDPFDKCKWKLVLNTVAANGRYFQRPLF